MSVYKQYFEENTLTLTDGRLAIELTADENVIILPYIN